MSLWHTLLLALALAFSGLALLAATMERHRADFTPLPAQPPWQAALRCAGCGLLALALGAALQRWPPALAVLAWLQLLSLAALALGLLLCYRPRRARQGLAGGLAACGALGLLQLF